MKTLSKVRYNIQESEYILEEKGYRKNEKHYDYNYNTIHVYIRKKPFYIMKGASYSKGVITIQFNNDIVGLLEASLSLYCWACCLPGLKGSKYQQYMRRCNDYVNGQQNTNAFR